MTGVLILMGIFAGIGTILGVAGGCSGSENVECTGWFCILVALLVPFVALAIYFVTPEQGHSEKTNCSCEACCAALEEPIAPEGYVLLHDSEGKTHAVNPESITDIKRLSDGDAKIYTTSDTYIYTEETYDEVVEIINAAKPAQP